MWDKHPYIFFKETVILIRTHRHETEILKKYILYMYKYNMCIICVITNYNIKTSK